MSLDPAEPNEWQLDCMKWRGRVLTGMYGHWCYDWDYLPIDETCPEWPCDCANALAMQRAAAPKPEEPPA